MANTTPLYALPVLQSNITQTRRSQKRKRNDRARRLGKEEEDDEGVLRHSHNNVNIEYSSVLTPDERSQRHLAGQSLQEEPPPFPFPHAPSSPANHEGRSTQGAGRYSRIKTQPVDGHNSSFRTQHTANMLTVLHKYLNSRDYYRSSQAFALLVRTSVLGNMVDLRRCGLWGIAGELLLQSNLDQISKNGLESAKTFYSRLALQYPWQHRSANAIDAQDFKCTMFTLWIYAVCVESERLQIVEDLDDSGLSQDLSLVIIKAKQWETGESERIAKEIDTLLRTVPFIDNLELIRLRGMIALWQADLFEALEHPHDEHESANSEHHYDDQQFPSAEDSISDRTDALRSSRRAQESMRVNNARNMATIMFAKLYGQEQAEDGEEQEDDPNRHP